MHANKCLAIDNIMFDYFTSHFYFNNKLYIDGKLGIQIKGDSKEREASLVSLEQDFLNPQTCRTAWTPQKDQRTVKIEIEESGLHLRDEYQLPGFEKEHQRLLQGAEYWQEKAMIIVDLSLNTPLSLWTLVLVSIQ